MFITNEEIEKEIIETQQKIDSIVEYLKIAEKEQNVSLGQVLFIEMQRLSLKQYLTCLEFRLKPNLDTSHAYEFQNIVQNLK
jgi:hypothetical protein